MKNTGKLLVTAITATVIISCSMAPNQFTGTETGNGTPGRVLGMDGKPAANAQVSIVPVDYNELDSSNGDTMLLSVKTDNNGYYSFKAVNSGWYNVFGESDTLKAYFDSVYISGKTEDSIATMTLRKTGAVAGIVLYASGRSIDNASIYLQGSRIYAAIDPQTSFFRFPNLAPGNYMAKVVSNTAGYFDLPVSVFVTEGMSDTVTVPFFLVSNSISSLAFAKGAMWIGSINGIASLQGGSWRAYGLQDGLSSSRINCMATGPDGTVWIGTSLRLARVRTGTLSENFVPQTISSMTNISALTTDSTGDVWIGTPQGLFFFNGVEAIPITSTDAITPIGVPSRQNMLTAISAIVCSGKTVIAGTQHGLYVRDSLAKWIEVPILAQYSVAVLVQGSGGTVWIGTNRGLFSWNNADTVKAIPADSSMDGSITSLAFTHGDSLLVGTVNGLFVYFDSLWSKPKQDALGPWISALAVDNDNVLWIGTNEGVFRMRNSEIDLLK